MSKSLLAGVELAPRDPILGLTEAYNADPDPRKVNLGVGVYYDDDGKVPVLECVRRAGLAMSAQAAPRNYLPIDGLPAYDRAVRALVLGTESAAVAAGRAVTVQTLGGTGALRVAADFLKRVGPDAQVWISDPSWENHRALFEAAGFAVNAYPYYDAVTHGLDFAGMIDALERLPAGAIVVLHGCCHNPTGVDPDPGQWTRVIEAVKARNLVPVIDIAYQGFAEGIAADGEIVRRFAEAYAPVFVTTSFSKSFSLYGERVGALSIVAGDADEAARVLSQLKRVVRTNYSNPPTYGSQIVAAVLTDAELSSLWERELGGMRERIKSMRRELAQRVQRQAPDLDLGFVTRQRGLFSYSGLSREAVERLRREYSIYAVASGRICVAALNSGNIDYVARAIAEVAR